MINRGQEFGKNSRSVPGAIFFSVAVMVHGEFISFGIWLSGFPWEGLRRKWARNPKREKKCFFFWCSAFLGGPFLERFWIIFQVLSSRVSDASLYFPIVVLSMFRVSDAVPALVFGGHEKKREGEKKLFLY